VTALKAIISTLVALAGALVVALGTGNGGSISDLSTKTWLLAIVSVLGSGGIVWWCQNGPWHPYIKSVVSFLSAGIASLVTALDDNVITQAEWLVAFVAAVTALGLVFQATNARDPGHQVS
jgi:uncharacterized membrane protein